MIMLGNLFIAVGTIVDIILRLYIWVLIIAALISWVSPDPYNPIVRFLRSVTEPVLRPVRRRLGVFGGIDFSPLIVILGIIFVRSFIIRTIIEYGYKLKGGF
ncbi:YGGT family protein [bacterium BMS3Bbin05]|nr:YGGT family protein [bacterium BMS3Bbin05]HDO22971.1 YggT family protein [Nitrospirota bacterium]HDZ87294.1 YggT family protein [Nitrospirota bacterium]